MSSSQLKERVLIPLAVITTTVAALGFLGLQLLGVSGASDPISPPVTTASAEPTEAMPSASVSAMPSESALVTAGPRLSVVVLNGTETAGLAKKVGDNLNFEDWVIEEVGNWTGDAVTQTTVFYPPGAAGVAQELADSKYVNGVIAPAQPSMNQTLLTLVLAK